MRIAYENLLDQIPTGQIEVSSETTLYEGTQVLDQRLTQQWRTTSPTAQTIIFSASADTIVGGNIGLIAGSSATNLVTDPENLTSANWAETNITVTTAQSIVGVPAYLLKADVTTGSYLKSAADIGIGVTACTVVITTRKGTSDTAVVLIRDNSAGDAVRLQVSTGFSAKTITYAIGTEAMPPEWIDDDTVRLYINPATSLVPGNTNLFWILPRNSTSAGATADTCIWSAPMVIDNTYPVPYVATSRSVVTTTYTQRIPPSGKFIIDCELMPYFPYDTGAYLYPWHWGTTDPRLNLRYDYTADKFQLIYENGGTARNMSSAQFDDGSSYRNINARTRLTCSFDLTTAAVTGTRLYYNGTLDVSTWSDVIDAFDSSDFSATLTLAGGPLDGIFRYFRIYGGTFSEAITTEAELDTALAKRQLLYNQGYQEQFNFDSVAIMGHNISEGAELTMEANNWNEWNYTDGSGSSIIQETLTWDDETILKMITKTKKAYIKFTINDPNNDDTLLKIGRIWAGPYIDIDPSSLDDFTVNKDRSDDVMHNRDRSKWANEGIGFRAVSLVFPRSATTMVNKIQTMYDFVGNHSSLIFCNFDTIRTLNNEPMEIVEPLYCTIDGKIVFRHRGRQKYTYALNLVEEK